MLGTTTFQLTLPTYIWVYGAAAGTALITVAGDTTADVTYSIQQILDSGDNERLLHGTARAKQIGLSAPFMGSVRVES